MIFLLFLFQIFWGVVKSEERLDSEDYALTDLIATPRLYLQSGNVTINFLPFIFYSILAFILGKLSLKKNLHHFSIECDFFTWYIWKEKQDVPCIFLD